MQGIAFLKKNGDIRALIGRCRFHDVIRGREDNGSDGNKLNWFKQGHMILFIVPTINIVAIWLATEGIY